MLQWNAEEVAAEQQEPHVAISSDQDPDDDVPLTTSTGTQSGRSIYLFQTDKYTYLKLVHVPFWIVRPKWHKK